MLSLRTTALTMAAVLILGGCASTKPRTLQSYELPANASLQEQEVVGRAVMVWRDPQVNLSTYTRFIIDPVAIYRGADAHFAGASEQELQELADFTQREFVRVAGSYLATAPGPGVGRIKITLAGLENDTPVLSTASHVIPAGLLTNLAETAGSKPGTFMGSATLAGELFDSQTGAVLGVVVVKNYPGAMNMSATLTSRAAHEAAITQFVDGFRRWQEKLHKQAQ